MVIVSCLVVTYNAKNYIRKTISSMINQSLYDIEILVLDNASNDGTIDIIESFANDDSRIKLIKSNDNIGAYKGLNMLLDISKGQFVAINDHDDLWHKDKLELQVNFLKNNPRYVGVGSSRINYFEKNNDMIIIHNSKKSTFAYHTSLLFRNNGFRYNLDVISKDVYFMKFVLCKENNNIFNLSAPLCVHTFRVDGNNYSNKLFSFRNRLKVFFQNKLGFSLSSFISVFVGTNFFIRLKKMSIERDKYFSPNDYEDIDKFYFY